MARDCKPYTRNEMWERPQPRGPGSEKGGRQYNEMGGWDDTGSRRNVNCVARKTAGNNVREGKGELQLLKPNPP